MRKPILILLLGVVGCVAAFAGFYFAGTTASREWMRDEQPELAWLKREFNLAAPEYQRILELHQAYLPKCAERCRLIEQQNAELRRLLAEAPEVTSEIQAVVERRAQIRAECETEMLRHFFAVSRTMPPEQGRRYLAWVEEQTFLRPGAMERQHQQNSSTAKAAHHHH